MNTLFDEKALKERIFGLYYRMKTRARPKCWKTGKRAGHIRVPGLAELPFTREQLWRHVVSQVPLGTLIRCPYCELIGRNASLIDLTNCVLDHVVPLARGGTWTLENIRCVCDDCNRLKGKLTLEFYIALMSAVEKWADQYDRANLYACLRTHGVALQAQRFGRTKPANALPAPPQDTLAMNLMDDDF